MRPFVISIHGRPVNIVKFNKEGDLFFTGGSDKTVAVFWTEPLECLGTFECPGAVKSLDVTSDSQYLIVGTNDGIILVFRALTGEKLRESKLDLGRIDDIALSMGDEHFLVIHTVGKTQESFVYLYSMEDYLAQEDYKSERFAIKSRIPYTRGTWGYLNAFIYLATMKGTIEVFSFPAREKIQEIAVHNDKITSLKFSVDFSLLITSSKDGKAKILVTPSLEVVKTFNSQRPLNSAVISPLMRDKEHVKYHALIGGGQDAREVTQTVAESGSFEVTFFNLIFESEVGSVKGHFGPVHSIDIHPQGRIFITGSEDGSVRVQKLDDAYFTSSFN